MAISRFEKPEKRLVDHPQRGPEIRTDPTGLETCGRPHPLAPRRYGHRCIGRICLAQALHAQRVRRQTAVVHLHPTYTVAALYAGLELDKICLEFPEIARYTCVGRSVPALAATSAELAQACELAFLACPCGQTPDIIGLDRHGVVAVGPDPWSAYEHIERLEHICQMVLASGAGRKNTTPPAIATHVQEAH